ncbi:MAG TPA: translocation/assembly module TamB domain-containing protein, partial [Opitutaceae bacterium]|nr:translocation/assembly module TamB domain-containing protein [Opitutaceae bacterium]
MRRFLIVCGILLAVVVVALAALPLWFGAFLSVAGNSLGLEFAKYERLGYARFALEDVVLDHPSVRVTAARVEVDSPIVLIFRPWSGRERSASVTTWQVRVKPNDSVSDEASSGALELRERLLDMAKHLDRWLPVAEVGAGTVVWDLGGLEIDSAVWKQRSFEVIGFRLGKLATDATATFSASGMIEFAASPQEGPWRVTAKWDDDAVRGEFGIWGQVAPFSTTFSSGKWLPDTASIAAAGWNVPGARVGLGESYQYVRGDAGIEWEAGRFNTTIDIAGEALPDSGAPPLSAKLRGHGDTQTAVVESLFVEIPGVSATLSAPVEIDRSGRIKSGMSDFTFAVDLEKQTWIAASGRASGSARLTPREDGHPLIEAKLDGTEMAWRDWRAAAIQATGKLDWPILEVSGETKDETMGMELVIRGAWDFERRELLNGHAIGTISGESLALLSPRIPAFRLATFTVEAHGPLQTLEHSGTAKVDELAVPGLNPPGLEMAWDGKGAMANIRDGIVRAGNSEILLSAQITKDAAQLETLRLVQDGVERLTLQTPASVQWSPTVEVGSVQLGGDNCSLTFSALSGESGELHVAARNIPSTWWTNFAPTRDVDVMIASLDFDGTWNDGPMSFETTGRFELGIGADSLADVELSASGDGDGVVLESLRVSQDEAPIFSSSGTLPISLHPGSERLVRIEAEGPLEVSTSSTSSPLFWEKLKVLTGVELIEPELKLELSGTWSAPQGTLRATANRVSVDNERIKFALPEIAALQIDATADRKQLSLERLSMLVSGQEVRATGRMPLGPDMWASLKADPVKFIRTTADLHLEIPDAEVAALSVYAPAFLSTEGKLQMDVTLKSGGEIDGSVRLQGASSRPLGPLGVLQQISADLRFAGRSVEIRELVATSGGQPVTLSGRIELPADAPPQFKVALKGANLPLVRRTGLMLRGDVDLQLTTSEGGVPLISGTARLRDSLYFSDIRDLIPSGGGGVSGRPPYFSVEKAPFNAWKLAVDVRGDDFMRLRTALFNGNLSTRFQISGTLGDPRSIGEATVDEGRLLLPFATFVVEHGSARLTVVEPFEPSL